LVKNVRTVLVDLLTDDLGAAIDTSDLEDRRGDGFGWLTAHVALRAVEWVLDAAGFGPDEAEAADLWQRLALNDTVDTLADAYWRHELASLSDDDLEWPLPVGSYVTLVEEVLGVDLTSMPVRSGLQAPVRFGAPAEEGMVRSIEAAIDFGGRFDPRSWLIQRRVGRHPIETDPTAELDRFIAHWAYRRNFPNPWVEVGRDDAFAHIVAVQRTSLVWSARPWWDPGADVARGRAAQFLACFTGDTRFFTNGHGYRKSGIDLSSNHFTINPNSMFDTGIVMMSPRIAGIWWHSEGNPHTPLGMSP
jgi:hypothetical protein